MTTSRVKAENYNEPATRKQLWALFTITKKNGKAVDYRSANLTRKQASDMIAKLTGVEQKSTLEKKVEQELVSEYEDKYQYIVGVVKEALNVKSVVENDTTYMKKNASFAMVGFGCGVTVVTFDKRSKVGVIAKSINGKVREDFEQKVRSAFSARELAYLKRIGCPFDAILAQDIRINNALDGILASYLVKKGVKNVQTKRFVD